MKFLAAKRIIPLFFISIAPWMMPVAQAGIPVIDGGNLAENIMTAMESVTHTAKQVKQLQTQLLQYRLLIQNTTKPDSSVWENAKITMANLVQANNTLKFYQNRLGSLQSYLNKYQDINHYQQSPCFNTDAPGTCTAADRAQLKQNRDLGYQAQKKTNDEMLKRTYRQQANISNDTQALQTLQNNAKSANGQLEAIGYANQLAAAQAEQLLQIRNLLLAQQTAEATRHAAELDANAQSEAIRRNVLKMTPPTPVK